MAKTVIRWFKCFMLFVNGTIVPWISRGSIGWTHQTRAAYCEWDTHAQLTAMRCVQCLHGTHKKKHSAPWWNYLATIGRLPLRVLLHFLELMRIQFLMGYHISFGTVWLRPILFSFLSSFFILLHRELESIWQKKKYFFVQTGKLNSNLVNVRVEL